MSQWTTDKMENAIIDSFDATSKSLATHLVGGATGSNSLQINESGAALTSGTSSKWRDSFETLNPVNFDYTSGIHANDLVTLDDNTSIYSVRRLRRWC